MSEYQYYEFQAVDRPLDEADKAALRRLSSRAEITANRFTNVYHYGDFRGNVRQMMERWFDLHLYVANWGTRILMMRLPKRLVDRPLLDQCVQAVDEVAVTESGENLIVEINFNGEESGYDYGDMEGDGWLDSLAPLRDDALAGDIRLCYVLWLTAVERRLVPPRVTEPLPGLGPLTPPLRSLAEFFDLDQDLVSAAAELPAVTEGHDSLAAASRKMIESLPVDEKTALLLRLVDGDPLVGPELRNRIRTAWTASQRQSGNKSRSVAELLTRSEALRKDREAREAKRKEAERLRKAREAERARRVRLEAIRQRGGSVWNDVEKEIEARNAQSYERAVALLLDLRSLAQETDTLAAFQARIQRIRVQHERKLRFIERLDAKTLW